MSNPPHDDDPAIMDQAIMDQARPDIMGLDMAGLDVTHDHLLGAGVAITQPAEGCRVGTDAVLLNAAVLENRGRLLDLGAGVGGVALCVAHRLDRLQVTAVEIDPHLAALARHNAGANRLGDRVRVLTADIAHLPPLLADSFDHVVSNPPYHYPAGTKPDHHRRQRAHMADGDGLDGWVRAAVWAAKSRGRISFICRADRGAELIHLFAVAGAGEAVVFPLWPRAGVPAGRVIVSVRKRVAGPGAILPGLVLHNADGSFTAAASAIMKGAALPIEHPARRQRPRHISEPPTKEPL
jgi:tRNA1(Val) A37 N6-methylase TrmN6